MKNILKIILILTITLVFPISILYGLRILNNGYTYEYSNRSLVITLTNGVWFEINEGEDLADDSELIFQNDTTDVEEGSIDFGLLYPTYIITMENDTASKTQTVERVGDTIRIENNININTKEFEIYTTRIYFSQYGEFETNNNTYTQEGCSVKISSEEGKISYDEEYAIVDIEYEIEDLEIDDLIEIEISCL